MTGMTDYRVELTPDDNDTVLLTFPDVPEAATFGEDAADAMARAPDALATALAGYIQDRRDIPPSPPGGLRVALPLLATMKLAAYEAMRAKGWRKADLARAMRLNPRQIDRLFNLNHASPIAQIEDALAACGQRATIELLAA